MKFVISGRRSSLEMTKRTIRIGRWIVICGLGSAIAAGAWAQETSGSYYRQDSVTGRNGKTATYQDSGSWGNGSFNDNREITGFNRHTATSNTTASREPGSTSRETTVTGFNGKTSTYLDNRSWGNGVYTNNKSYTGVNGRTGSDTVTRSGGWVTNTLTGPNGNSRTYSHRVRCRR